MRMRLWRYNNWTWWDSNFFVFQPYLFYQCALVKAKLFTKMSQVWYMFRKFNCSFMYVHLIYLLKKYTIFFYWYYKIKQWKKKKNKVFIFRRLIKILNWRWRWDSDREEDKLRKYLKRRNTRTSSVQGMYTCR